MPDVACGINTQPQRSRLAPPTVPASALEAVNDALAAALTPWYVLQPGATIPRLDQHCNLANMAISAIIKPKVCIMITFQDRVRSSVHLLRCRMWV